MKRYAFIIFAGVIVAVVCLDVLTKSWASASLARSPIPIIPGFFDLSYGENTGIAFGLFQQHGRMLTFLSPLAFLALGVYLGWYVWSSGEYLSSVACGMIVGGAFGNVWSRLVDGYVVDFFDFHLAGYHWPAFNVADSSLCCGVALFLFYSMRGSHSTRSPGADMSPD